MVVKDKIGRRRYIIAEKNDKLKNLLAQFGGKIAYEDGKFVVIFCKHFMKDFAIKVLNSAGIKTYKTTGTIKKAKKIISNLHLPVK